MTTQYRRIAQIRSVAEFREHLQSIGVAIPIDEEIVSGSVSPLAQSCGYRDRVLGNRFAILPMEGWDGTVDGFPSDLTRRRWRRFGESGAKLIWGGEAAAVRHEGRANPHQLMITEATWGAIAALREDLVKEHEENFGTTDDLLVGLQLTHSGRFSQPEPDWRRRPRILYRHPFLDRKFGIPADYPILSDDDIRAIVDDFVRAAKLALRAGFDFVDVKHCHGYLGHEFLSAVDRAGSYGGSFENRTRFLRDVVEGVRAEAPGLDIGVRVSIFDFLPFEKGPDGTGEPVDLGGAPYRHGFGCDPTGLRIDLTEPKAFLDLLAELGISLVCPTAGSPYYNPHIQRPALFPPSDGYQPPEDPLVGVARQIAAAAELRKHRPELIFVGTAYSYLQEFFPNVAQAVVSTGAADFVGIGRLALSYPTILADILTGRPLERKLLCRTFSDCTTAPRNHLVSGCYPLDDFYKQHPSAEALDQAKHGKR